MKGLSFNSVSFKARKNKKEIIQIISNVIDSGIFLNGQQEKKLIDKLQNYFGNGLIITTASGHDSLFIALSCLNLKNDDEVIFPVNAYPTAFPIALSKVRPVPADVDENGQLDANMLVKKITKKTKVIVLVHLYGLVGNLKEIIKISKRNKIILIEDCAQAFGSKYMNKYVGTLGDIGCFSFYPTKNLGTLGDGGAIWTKNKKFYQHFLKAKMYGEKNRYESEFAAAHSRMPEMQAAVLNTYLRTVKTDIIKRKIIYQYYKQRFYKEKLLRFIRLLETDHRSEAAVHQLVVEAKKRDALKMFLSKINIQSLVHYPKPIHLVPAFHNLKFKRGDFPLAERLSKNILSLPFHQYLTEKQVDHIIKAIKKFYYA